MHLLLLVARIPVELQTNYKFRLEADGNFIEHSMPPDKYPFWSIIKHSDAIWYSDTEFPIPTDSGSQNSNEDFYVSILIKNNNTEISSAYYALPFSLSINGTPSVTNICTNCNAYCKPDFLTCYIDVGKATPYSTLFYWHLNLPAGSYKFSVQLGQHPNDSPPPIDRIVRVI